MDVEAALTLLISSNLMMKYLKKKSHMYNARDITKLEQRTMLGTYSNPSLAYVLEAFGLKQ